MDAAQAAKELTPGTRVAITQQIPARNRTWTNIVRGEVVNFTQRMTGSWFAHAKHDRLWLDRLTVRKDDGELVTLILDEYSHIQVGEESVVRSCGKNR